MMHVLGWIACCIGQIELPDNLSPVAVSAPAEVLVVCHDELLPGLQDWLKWRESQGYRIALLRHWQSKDQIRRAIRRQTTEGRLRWVVLVGDVPGFTHYEPSSKHSIPTAYQSAKQIARFGPDRVIASDNWFADVNDDGVPDVAIGRMCVETVEELGSLVAKTRRREENRVGDWRSRIQLTAGASGFGTLADQVLEWVARRLLVDSIPSEYVTQIMCGDWRSPYFPDPRRFRSNLFERWREGCDFWVYLGHSQSQALQEISVPGGRYPTLELEDTWKLDGRHAPPIAVMLSCYAGAFDEPNLCLAEGMLRAPGGAVATISATRTTMPYAMAVLGGGMLHEYFGRHHTTLGELLLRAKQHLAVDEPSEDYPLYTVRQWLDRLAETFVPGSTRDALRVERYEHIALFHLLGDPLLALDAPRQLAVRTDSTIQAGKTLTVQLEVPWSGEARLELRCRCDGMKWPVARRSQFSGDASWLDDLQRQYDRTQDQVWCSLRIHLEQGLQSLALPVPPEARGACVVRVVLRNEKEEALGASSVFVYPPSANATNQQLSEANN